MNWRATKVEPSSTVSETGISSPEAAESFDFGKTGGADGAFPKQSISRYRFAVSKDKKY